MDDMVSGQGVWVGFVPHVDVVTGRCDVNGHVDVVTEIVLDG